MNEYFEDDAAQALTERIFEERAKLAKALAKEEEHTLKLETTQKNDKRHVRSKVTAAKRDQHRANTTIRALKEALQFVILERLCKADGKAHAAPDVEEYLRQQELARAPMV